MKKLVSVLLVFVLCTALLATSVSAASNGSAELTLQTKKTALSGTGVFAVAVDLSGSGLSGIASYVVSLEWDPAVLELSVDNNGEFCYFTDAFADGYKMVTDTGHSIGTDTKNGVMTIASGSASNRKVSFGTLFFVKFRPLSSKADTTSVTVRFGSDKVASRDALTHTSGPVTKVNKESFLVLKLNGGSKYENGDVNANGSFDAMDYMLLKTAVLGKKSLTPSQKSRSDLDGNGEINAMDYMKVKTLVLKKK